MRARGILLVACAIASLSVARAQSDVTDGLDSLLKSPKRDLWLTVIVGLNSDSNTSTFRDALHRAEQTQAATSIVDASLALALALISGDETEVARQDEALQLMRSAEQRASLESLPRVRFVTCLALASLNRLPEAQQILSGMPLAGDPAITNVVQHLRAMLASWQGDRDAAALSARLPGTRYPFTAIPQTPEWEVVRAAHYLAMTRRYGYAWSSLRLDVLDRTVSKATAEALAKAETEKGPASDEAWDAAVKQFEADEAHDRPADAVRHLAVFLSRAMNGLAAEQRGQILQFLARASARQGDLTAARRYLVAARAALVEAIPNGGRRLTAELELARSIAQGGNEDLEIEAYEGAEASSRSLPETALTVQTRFEILQELLRLAIHKGDWRKTADIYNEAARVAARLDAEPRLASGRRFHAERLQLAELRALAELPSRRHEAAERLLPLLVEMDRRAPVWSRPAEDVLEALSEARGSGGEPTIEDHLRRVSAADVQQAAFPVLAVIHMNNREWPQAEKALTQALYVDLQRKAVCGSQEQLQYWSDLAFVAAAQGDIKGAAAWEGERINCAGAMNRTSRQSADALVARAKLLHTEGDYYGAEYLLRRALESLVRQTYPGDLSLAAGELALATVMSDEDRTSEAVTHVAAATRSLLSASIDARGWRELEADTLTLLARLSAQSGEATRLAFEVAQHGLAKHAAAALEAFSARAALRDPALAALVQRRVELQRRRELIDVRFQSVFGTEAASHNTAERAALVRELEDVDAALRAATDQIDAFANYADLVSGRAVPLDALTQSASLRWLLDEREALLLFTQTDDAFFVHAVKRGGARLIKVDLSRQRMNDLVAEIRRSLEISSSTGLRPFAFTAAADVYQRVWAPVRSFLQGVEHVLVVNDGPLGSLPLELLVASVPAAGAAPRWLDEEVAFSYPPSVSAVRSLRGGVPPSHAMRPVVVFGPPDLGGAAAEQKAPVEFHKYFPMGAAIDPSLPCSGRLADLPPSIIRLARDVAVGLGGDVGDTVLGPAFTEARFRETFTGPRLAQYKVVTFVTHGLVAGELGSHIDAEPALVMTPPAGCRSTGGNDDGLLTASEISELSLDAEWALLLACNTASPDGVNGAEPLSGLARAFLFAGARALLVSHWSVDASATAEFVNRMFSSESLGGGGKAQRVRAARRAVRTLREGGVERFSHPALWAGFVLVGDGR